MEKELVSVIMTSYNSNEKFLRQAIESVLNQNYENFEFIIVDDGSTNSVLKKVLDELRGINKIKIIYQKNKGLCNARNTGIKNSKGKLISFIDDDDIWYENKLKETVDYFNLIKEKDFKISMVFTQAEIIDESNKKYGIYGFNVKGNIFRDLLGKNIIGPPSSVLIEKDKLCEVGLFNESFIYAEDIELWYRLSKKYNIYSLNKPLIQYRYRKNSLSKNYEKMAQYTEKALQMALKDGNLTKKEENKILSKYYKDFACLFFSNNNIEYFKKYLFKYIKYIRIYTINVIDIKLIFGFLSTLLGKRFIKWINIKKMRNNTIPSAYLNICDYNKKGDLYEYS